MTLILLLISNFTQFFGCTWRLPLSTHYYWYHCHPYVPQPFYLFGKIQVFVNIFILNLNSKIHLMKCPRVLNASYFHRMIFISTYTICDYGHCFCLFQNSHCIRFYTPSSQDVDSRVSLFHSFIIWLIILTQYLHNLHLLFGCISSIFALIAPYDVVWCCYWLNESNVRP